MKKRFVIFLVIIAAVFIIIQCTPVADDDLNINNNTAATNVLPPAPVQSAKWTFMGYIDGANNLEDYAISDVSEMENVDLSSEPINIIVLLDLMGYDYGNWSDTRIYYISYHPETGIQSTEFSCTDLGLSSTNNYEELNMGDPATLQKFVDFCKTKYPAEHYILDLWNHGDGYRSVTRSPDTRAICWDDETANEDTLYLNEVQQALSGRNIDIVYMDACLMGMIEVAYELGNAGVKYLVSSSIEVPGNGGDYTDIFTRIKNSGIDTLTPSEFADKIVVSYSNQYTTVHPESDWMNASVNLSNIPAVVTQVKLFAEDITNKLSILQIFSNRLNSQLYYKAPEVIVTGDTNTNVYKYADLYGFAKNCYDVSNSIGTALMSSITNAVEHLVLSSDDMTNHHPKGLSILFEQSDDTSYWLTGTAPYTNDFYTNRVDFAKASGWFDFLTWYNAKTTNNFFLTNNK